jgi:MFS family permease
MVGLALAGEGVGMIIGDIPAGMLLRRYNHKWVMIVGLASLTVSVLALILDINVFTVIFFRIIAGFGSALFSVSRHAYVADISRLGNRGRIISVFGGLMRVGDLIGPAVSGVVAAAFGMDSAFILFGVACTAALAMIYLYTPQSYTPSDQQECATGKETGKKNHLWDTIKNNYYVLLTAGSGQFFVQMIRQAKLSIIPLYASQVLDLDVQAVGFIMSIAQVFDIVLFYPAGVIMDRWGRKFAIVPSFFIQAVGMALVPLSTGFSSLLLVNSIISFGNGLSSGSMLTIGADLAPKESRGEFLGLWRLIGDGGKTGSPLIVGAIAEVVSLPVAAIVMSGAGFISTLINIFLVPETLKKPAPAAKKPVA